MGHVLGSSDFFLCLTLVTNECNIFQYSCFNLLFSILYHIPNSGLNYFDFTFDGVTRTNQPSLISYLDSRPVNHPSFNRTQYFRDLLGNFSYNPLVPDYSFFIFLLKLNLNSKSAQTSCAFNSAMAFLHRW